MNKNAFIQEMKSGGDCYINYISPTAKKHKYHVGTTDFSESVSPYIASKLTKYTMPKMSEHQVLVFCYDIDTFKPIDTTQVTSILAINKVIKQGLDE